MKFTFFTAILFMLIVISSCKREPYPEAELEGVVFRMYGTYDGGPYNLLAGENYIYLNSFSEQDEFGIRGFVTQFNSLDCVGCAPKLEIQINDNEVTNPDASATLDIAAGDALNFVINEDESDFLTLHFHAQGGGEDNITWDFGDGQQGVGEHPEHTYDNPGIYTVIMENNSVGGEENNYVISQTIYVGGNFVLAVPFDIQDVPGDIIEISFPDQLPPGLVIENWTINGEFSNEEIIAYDFENEDEVEFCLHYHNTILDEDGFYCMTFYDDVEIQNYDGLFNYQWSAATMNLNNVQIRFRSVEGNVYTSTTELNQQNNNQFFIDSVEEYAEGIDGFPAKIVHAHFSAEMVNVEDPDDVKNFTDMEIVFGIVYQ